LYLECIIFGTLLLSLYKWCAVDFIRKTTGFKLICRRETAHRCIIMSTSCYKSHKHNRSMPNCYYTKVRTAFMQFLVNFVIFPMLTVNNIECSSPLPPVDGDDPVAIRLDIQRKLAWCSYYTMKRLMLCCAGLTRNCRGIYRASMQYLAR